MLVASEDALDQYFMREPDTLLGRRVEAAILDHASARVLAGHVRAAAYEAPLTDADERHPRPRGARRRARRIPSCRQTPAGIVWGGRDHPAARIPLRSAEPDAFSVVDAATGSVLGLVERSRAYSTVHEGAVYLHLGESYLVRELDLTSLRAIVEPFTRRLVHAGEEGDDDDDRRRPARIEQRLGLELAFGEIEVTEQVVGYERQDDRLAGADRARAARPARDDLRDRGGLVPARAGAARGRSTRCRGSSARCTRPSTR